MNNPAGGIDVEITTFGGSFTEMTPADVPEGGSPDSQDVAFLPGSVFTRPAFKRVYSGGISFDASSGPWFGCDRSDLFIAGADLGHAAP